MSLIKKIDVPKHFAARRADRRMASRTVPPQGAGMSETDSAVKNASAASLH